MWYYDKGGIIQIEDHQVNRDIEEEIREKGNNDDFQFVWYPNPKPTFRSKQFHHFQVFWIK